jgi:hypothetical protein
VNKYNTNNLNNISDNNCDGYRNTSLERMALKAKSGTSDFTTAPLIPSVLHQLLGLPLKGGSP